MTVPPDVCRVLSFIFESIFVEKGIILPSKHNKFMFIQIQIQILRKFGIDRYGLEACNDRLLKEKPIVKTTLRSYFVMPLYLRPEPS